MKLKINKRVAIWALALFLGGGCVGVNAETFSVDTSADLLAALAAATAGDSIEVAPGTYVTDSTAGEFPTADGDTVWHRWFFRAQANGTASAPITLKSQDSDDPAILSGTGWASSGYGLYVTGDHWIIENIKITEAAKGILVSGADYSQITDVEIYSIGQEGIHILDGSDYTIIDSINLHDVGVKNDGYGEGIYIGSDNGVWWEGDGTNTGEKGFYYHRDVIGTHIKNSTIGPNITAEPFDIKEGAGGTIVENCVIYATGISGQNFADSHIDIKGYETVIKHNTFYQNDNAGVLRSIMIVPRISAGVDAIYTAHDNYIHNNNFYLNSDVDIVVANSGSENTYAWENTRDPIEGDYYNSRVIEGIPDGYYDDVALYYVNASAGDYGTISPQGTVEVQEGLNQSFLITANAGYVIDDVLVNGVSVGAVSMYTFSDMAADQSISVSFVVDESEPVLYQLTATAEAHGSITPAGSLALEEGSEQSFTISADDGYIIADVTVNGVSVGAQSQYTFSDIVGDQTIVASFSEAPEAIIYYQVEASAGINGSVTPAGSFDVQAGASQTFNFIADSGYQVADVIVNGVSVGALESYSVADVEGDISISVSFEWVDDETVVDDAYIELSAPYGYDGAGSFKWKTTEIPGHINSWCLESLTVNGQDITNTWVGSYSLPEKIDGYYYFEYHGSFDWSHIEIE